MYIADMFCYGRSTDSVGVNGIVGCMGVFVVSGATFSAVHLPDSINYNQAGRVAFAQFVTQGAGWNAAGATMIGVLNGDNRPAAGAELTDLARRLGVASYRLVRLRKNIDVSPTKEAAAAAVLCLKKPGPGSTIELRYQMDKNVRWLAGQGEARSGQYRAMRDDARLAVNAGWGAGWQEVNGTNCDLSLRHG
jgi:hypothetical protein